MCFFGNNIDRIKPPLSVSNEVRIAIAFKLVYETRYVPAKITFYLFSLRLVFEVASTADLITGTLSPVTIASFTIALPSITSKSQGTSIFSESSTTSPNDISWKSRVSIWWFLKMLYFPSYSQISRNLRIFYFASKIWRTILRIDENRITQA